MQIGQVQGWVFSGAELDIPVLEIHSSITAEDFVPEVRYRDRYRVRNDFV